MLILGNDKELERILENHNRLVKDKYKTDIAGIIDFIYDKGHENLKYKECYVEINSVETKSGHAEILDW